MVIALLGGGGSVTEAAAVVVVAAVVASVVVVVGGASVVVVVASVVVAAVVVGSTVVVAPVVVASVVVVAIISTGGAVGAGVVVSTRSVVVVPSVVVVVVVVVTTVVVVAVVVVVASTSFDSPTGFAVGDVATGFIEGDEVGPPEGAIVGGMLMDMSAGSFLPGLSCFCLVVSSSAFTRRCPNSLPVSVPSSLRISSGVYTLKTRLRLGLREAREDGLVRARIVRIVWIFMIVYYVWCVSILISSML